MNYKELKDWLLEYEGICCLDCVYNGECIYSDDCKMLCPREADEIIAKIKELNDEGN